MQLNSSLNLPAPQERGAGRGVDYAGSLKASGLNACVCLYKDRPDLPMSPPEVSQVSMTCEGAFGGPVKTAVGEGSLADKRA